MAKSIKRAVFDTAKDTRDALTHYYINKYFALWVSQFDVTGDLTYQQIHYMLKLFWERGEVCAFRILPFTKDAEMKPTNEVMAFSDFAPMDYNTYDFPIRVQVINHRGVTFFPSEPLQVDKDIVIGWASENQKPLFDFVKMKIDQIVNVEMVMATNLITCKMPFIIAISPEDTARMESLINKLLSDDPVVYGDFSDLQAIKTLVNSSPYLLDKLQDFKTTKENELMTLLGIKNNPIEKRERLIRAEVEANDEEVNTNANSWIDPISKFLTRCNDVFGTDYAIRYKITDDYSDENSNDEEEKGGKEYVME